MNNFLRRRQTIASVANHVPSRTFVSKTNARKIDHHALLVISSVATYAQATHSVLARGWMRKLVDQEPVVVFSLMLGGLGILLPVTVVPARRAIGLDTTQYDGAQAH